MNNLFYKKGNISISSLIGWGVTIAVTSIGFTYNQINKVADGQAKIVEAQTQTVQRISVVETKSDQYEKDITEINKKLDILITQKNAR